MPGRWNDATGMDARELAYELRATQLKWNRI